MNEHVFTPQQAALAYALSAERIWGNDSTFLENNPAIIPIFVSQLFQSLEISIKHAGITSGLFTEKEARARERKRGHGIKEISDLTVERLNGRNYDPLIQAIGHFQTKPNLREIVRLMIQGDEFKRTRESYADRRLGYGEIENCDFAMVGDIGLWIEAVKQVAISLPQIVDVISKWKSSPGVDVPFCILLDSDDDSED